MVPGQGSDRYDEVPASAEDLEVIDGYKLSKPELRNLLPEVCTLDRIRAPLWAKQCRHGPLDSDRTSCMAMRHVPHACEAPPSSLPACAQPPAEQPLQRIASAKTRPNLPTPPSRLDQLQDWDQINTDFFSNKRDETIPLPEYRLNVLWTEKNLAVAIDQVYSRVRAAGTQADLQKTTRRCQLRPFRRHLCPLAAEVCWVSWIWETCCGETCSPLTPFPNAASQTPPVPDCPPPPPADGAQGQVSPLTEYYLWPRQDAWEELRMNLEGRPWISER